MAKAKRRPDRDLEDVLTEIRAAAMRLDAVAGELRLAELVAELERDHYPADPAELERMGSDEVCPSLPLEVAGDVGAAGEALAEALAGLEKAAGRTPENIRAAWRQRLLDRVEDPATRYVLGLNW